MPNLSYTCLPSGLDHLIVHVIMYTHCSIGLFPKSGTNELNQGRKDQILAKATEAEMTRLKQQRTETTLIPVFV